EALRLVRDVDESGYLTVPWEINGAGRLMASSATLIERPQPYRIGVELARGKLNQLRGQSADWRSVGLQLPDSLDSHIRAAGHRRATPRRGPAGRRRRRRRRGQLGRPAADLEGNRAHRVAIPLGSDRRRAGLGDQTEPSPRGRAADRILDIRPARLALALGGR